MKSDPMTDIEHQMAMQALGLAAQLLTPHAETLGRLIKAEREMHTHLHITDPTMYRAALHSDNLRHSLALAKAGLAFVLAVQEVKGEIGVSADG